MQKMIYKSQKNQNKVLKLKKDIKFGLLFNFLLS